MPQTRITTYYRKRKSTSVGGRSKRRRFTRGRRMTISRSLRSSYNVHHFRRQVQINAITGNAVFVPYLNGQSFSFNQLPNSGEFTSLYDLYRINKVVIKFYLDIAPDAQAANLAYYPKLFSVVDHDDANVPASLNELREHANCRVSVLRPTRPTTLIWTPSVLAVMFRTAVASTYSPKYKQWIDMANIDVPHYGLKFGIDNFSNTNYSLRQEMIMYYSCKHAR